MDYIYHGSHIHGLTTLKPNNSTHGRYVYGTPDKSLAIVFSQLFGDDFLYYLGRDDKNSPWNLVERVPGVFPRIFNTDASVYKVDASSFKDIHTGFCERVTASEVSVLEEEYIENLNDAIAELEVLGFIKLYHYPNRPLSIPFNDSDLIDKVFHYAESQKREIQKPDFARLLYFHPDLVEQVNNSIKEKDLTFSPFTTEDLRLIFLFFTEKYSTDPINSQMIPLAIEAYNEYDGSIVASYLESERVPHV